MSHEDYITFHDDSGCFIGQRRQFFFQFGYEFIAEVFVCVDSECPPGVDWNVIQCPVKLFRLIARILVFDHHHILIGFANDLRAVGGNRVYHVHFLRKSEYVVQTPFDMFFFVIGEDDGCNV